MQVSLTTIRPRNVSQPELHAIGACHSFLIDCAVLGERLELKEALELAGWPETLLAAEKQPKVLEDIKARQC